MAARILAAAHGLRLRPRGALPGALRAALAVPKQDTRVEADLAALPPPVRAGLEAGFALEARALARRLGTQVAAGEGKAAQPLAHALAGCAAAFGRPRLAALARLAGRSTALGEHATARAALAALAEELPPAPRRPSPPPLPDQRREDAAAPPHGQAHG